MIAELSSKKRVRPQLVSRVIAGRRANERSLAFALLGFLIVVLSSACSTKKPAPPSDTWVTDELGRTIHVSPRPQRIISLAPSVTETLFALGLEDRVVGVTTFCDYPPEAQQKAKVGDTLKPSIERIVALKPDLAIASTSSQLEQFVKRLDELGVPVYVSNPRNIEGVLDSIKRIGEAAGIADRSFLLSEELRARVGAIEHRVAERDRPKVFFILGSEPLITAGGPSFITDLIARAGGESISAQEKNDYPQYSLETAVARRPDVIFLQAGQVELPARLKGTPAARSGRVFHLDEAVLLRPGPRLVDGLEQMAMKIHPEAFEE